MLRWKQKLLGHLGNFLTTCLCLFNLIMKLEFGADFYQVSEKQLFCSWRLSCSCQFTTYRPFLQFTFQVTLCREFYHICQNSRNTTYVTIIISSGKFQWSCCSAITYFSSQTWSSLLQECMHAHAHILIPFPRPFMYVWDKLRRRVILIENAHYLFSQEMKKIRGYILKWQQEDFSLYGDGKM